VRRLESSLGSRGRFPKTPTFSRLNGGFLASARSLPKSHLMAVSLLPGGWHGSEAVDVDHGQLVDPKDPGGPITRTFSGRCISPYRVRRDSDFGRRRETSGTTRRSSPRNGSHFQPQL